MQVAELSQHLFWDVDRQNLDLEKHKKLIVQRVLEYGLYSDWKRIVEFYGVHKIAETAAMLRALDDKSLAFISLISGIPKEKFLCYITKRSIPKHWNF